jgi:hypothetical protein
MISHDVPLFANSKLVAPASGQPPKFCFPWDLFAKSVPLYACVPFSPAYSGNAAIGVPVGISP